MTLQTLGQYIRQLRDGRDLSLREFAQKLDLTAPYLSDIELGRRFPSDEVLTKMASVLEVTVADLRSHDFRPPVDELKEKIQSDPQFAVMLRRAIEHSDFDSKRLSDIVDGLNEADK